MARTAAELRDYAEEHLLYEIWMASALTARMWRHVQLFDRGLSAADGPLAEELLELPGRNADIESFAMHIRNLNWFFYPTKRKQGDVIAADYFNRVDDWNGVRPARPQSLARVNARVPVEIVHLSSGRLDLREDDKRWPYEQMWRDLAMVIGVFLDNAPDGRVSAKFREAVASLLPGSATKALEDMLSDMRRKTLLASARATTTATPLWSPDDSYPGDSAAGTAVLPPKREPPDFGD